jgi:phosphomannomutase
MSQIKFGTDGWRALMDKDFTFENVGILAQAFCDYMNEKFQKESKKSAPKIVVGYDFRKNSENFAKLFADVMVSNGLEVILSNAACPTPAVSYTIVNEKFDAGIAVTASHNPAGYNGIKIKSDFGSSADKSITDGVESFIGKNQVKKTGFKPNNPVIRNINDKYLVYLKNYLRLDVIKNAPFRILVDSMHGVGAKHIENILAGGKIKVTTIRSERDETFGGTAPEPIPHNLKIATEMMKSGDYDLCVVTDGDADRVGAIRPGGEFISPGKILSLIMMHFVEDLKKTGSVVTTISNTALIYKVANRLGLKVHETSVGFKYVVEIMRRENVLIGGEESGGIAFQNYLFERDGMLSGLLLMEMMAMRNLSADAILKNIEREFGKLSYVRADIDYPNELKDKLFQYLMQNPPKELLGHPVKNIKNQDGMKITLNDDSWLLFRLSGTEPILRIYSEATSQALAESLVKHGKELSFNLPAAV